MRRPRIVMLDSSVIAVVGNMVGDDLRLDNQAFLVANSIGFY